MRILLADDHSLFLDGLKSLLEAAGQIVIGQVTTGEAAIAETIRLNPDLVLLDISLHGMNGLEVLKTIHEESPEVAVVMLTIADDDDSLIKAIEYGASGYLLKSQTGDTLLKSLNALENGELAITRNFSSRLIRGLLNKSRDEKRAELLTDREIQLLELLARGQGNKAIAQEMAISENTVKYHIKKILQKLGVQNRTEAVLSAVSNGLIKLDQHPSN